MLHLESSKRGKKKHPTNLAADGKGAAGLRKKRLTVSIINVRPLSL